MRQLGAVRPSQGKWSGRGLRRKGAEELRRVGANGFGFVVTTAVGVVAGTDLCCLRAARRPRHSGRWLQTQTLPELTFSSSMEASRAGQNGGVSFTLLISFGAHCDTATKSSSGVFRATSGSGNHLVEIGAFTVAHNALGLPDGEYLALPTHSGSRGTGAHRNVIVRIRVETAPAQGA